MFKRSPDRKLLLPPGMQQVFSGSGGPNPIQTEVLVNNARSKGMLLGVPKTIAGALKGLKGKVKSLFNRGGTPKAELLPKQPVAEITAAKATQVKPVGIKAKLAATTLGIRGKVSSLFTRIRGAGSSASAAGSVKAGAYPIPTGTFSGATSVTASKSIVPKVSSGAVTSAPSSDAGLLASAAGRVRNAFRNVGNAAKNAASKTGKFIKGAADKTALTARRGANAVGSTAKTGFLSGKYALDPRAYHEIPIHGDTVLKLRGTYKSTAAIKTGRWTTNEFKYSSSWPPKSRLASRIDAIAAKPGARGLFGRAVNKLKGLA